MLWDINVIPNEQDNGYLLLPPGVLHMSALGRFGRFTLFSPRVSPSKRLPCSFCFVLCFGFGVFVALLCLCFLFCKCFGIPNSPRSLDLDDRQGLIASSAMQQKKSTMTMQLPLAQMANRDGEAGMETMLWDINVIPNEQDNGYLMLPPGVLHMSALGRFGRFTLFSPRVSPSKHLPCSFCFALCFGFGVFVALSCFCFLFCKCFGIPNSPRSLDLDDRQGLIASSAMQQKKKLNKERCRLDRSNKAPGCQEGSPVGNSHQELV